MWFVTLDRHHKYAWHRQWEFKSKYWIVAYPVYLAWYFIFLMSNFYLKQVSIFKSKDGVLYLRGAEKHCTDPYQLKRLQWARKNSKSRRYWDYS